jgi:hypothetical protein
MVEPELAFADLKDDMDCAEVGPAVQLLNLQLLNPVVGP